ncbi:hypothetical protein IHV12_22010 [Fictibacillus sp. 7GRE50]|jgi:hypothetical protein|uniref:hypothetical protein n=1 Tax=unclassified Fictibacillus TaxID=2644029 RepID=UPI0018CDE3B4|nr:MULTISPECIES: hypothetical protein [unclassified Fictibacillus]MBH0167587.1 hypothetical protein [Fictibacillus sp. 7GRE50]MBH0176158.1 hypothetical protein [Fictibacillus sp. 23RED33]
MQKLSIALYLRVQEALKNQKGAQSLEWLGIAALLIMVVGIASTFLGGAGKGRIEAVLEGIISSIEDQVGGK